MSRKWASHIVAFYLSIYVLVLHLEVKNIDTLVQGLAVAGNHTIEWNAEGYPSGVYFVKLNAEEFTQTQKLMLVK